MVFFYLVIYWILDFFPINYRIHYQWEIYSWRLICALVSKKSEWCVRIYTRNTTMYCDRKKTILLYSTENGNINPPMQIPLFPQKVCSNTFCNYVVVKYMCIRKTSDDLNLYFTCLALHCLIYNKIIKKKSTCLKE